MGRLLLLLLLLFLGYTLVQVLGRVFSGHRRTPPEKTPQGEEMVRDPSCGTFLARSTAIEASIKGQRLFFCSEKCRDAYRARK